MKSGKFLCLGMALGAMLMAGSGARADLVTYATTGTFGSSGTSTYSQNGVSIVYNNGFGVGVNVSPISLVSFGTFNTSLTTAPDLTPVSDTFTLKIFQTAPTSGNATFVGSLTGTLSTNASTAFVQFAAPLSQTIGAELYSILSADNNTPGRVNLSSPKANAGISTIAGQITAPAAVPEPSTMALAASGALTLAGMGYRRSRRSTQALAA